MRTTGVTTAPALELRTLGAALEDSLLPVFVVLLALAALNVAVASSFPRHADPEPPRL
jgi:hypothetical protein